jgi:hypothetical protein
MTVTPWTATAVLRTARWRNIRSSVISVDTTAGQTAADVVAALAAAINENAALQQLGIYAITSGSALITNGSLGQVTIADPGLSQVLSLRLQGSLLWWSSVGGATGYDVVQGDLLTLNSSAGDFTLATQACVADDQATTSLPSPGTPASGGGAWYVVRYVGPAGNGTYDTTDPSQVGLRDAEIDASAQACP